MTTWKKQIKACEACGASLIFLQARTGKFVPVNAESVRDGDERFDPHAGHVAHWASCADPDRFRKGTS